MQDALSSGEPLAGVRVIELSDGWTAHCGRILADLGADVIKVEPPSGDSARWRPPFIGGRPGPDRSFWWIALNANKRGVTLDLQRADDRERLRALVDRADVLVESVGRAMDDLGLTEAIMANERLIRTTISPYGSTGPLSSVPASDLEVTAASGALWLAGEPDRAPVRTTLPQTPFWAGMYAAMGTLMAYFARAVTGRGQHVDTSAQASMVTVTPPASVHREIRGEEHSRLGPYLIGRSIVGARFRNVWRCADGYVSFAIQGGAIGRRTGQMLVRWMKERGEPAGALLAIDWDTFDNTLLSQDDVERIEADIQRFLEQFTKREFFAGVVARNMLGYPVATVADIEADPQLDARGFWQEVDLPDGEGRVAFPGGFALFDGERPRIRLPAPRLGEHNAQALA